MECNKIKLRGPWIISIETTEFHPKLLLNDRVIGLTIQDNVIGTLSSQNR